VHPLGAMDCGKIFVEEEKLDQITQDPQSSSGHWRRKPTHPTRCTCQSTAFMETSTYSAFFRSSVLGCGPPSLSLEHGVQLGIVSCLVLVRPSVPTFHNSSSIGDLVFEDGTGFQFPRFKVPQN
jgi:hypothetical protein